MARTDVACESGQLYCYPLDATDASDELDIMGFEAVDPSGAGLVAYLQRFAAQDQRAGTMRTYLVRDKLTDELVGYFSLKAGMVSLGESQVAGAPGFDTLPGIELANFAVDARYRRAHPESRGCGRVIFSSLVTVLAERAAAIVGACLLYIYSLPVGPVMANYASYGFRRLPAEDEELLHARLKPRYDRDCIFMYMVL